jgi:uncharacterized membrane protein
MKKSLIILVGLIITAQANVYRVTDVKPIYDIEKECTTTTGQNGTGEVIGGAAGAVVGGGVGASVGHAILGRTGGAIGGILGGIAGSSYGNKIGGKNESTTCRDIKTVVGYKNFFMADGSLYWMRASKPLDNVEFTVKK